MVSVSIFRVFTKWPRDFLMQVITPIFQIREMHLQTSGCYLVTSQVGVNSSSDMAFSEVDAVVECYCWKVNCYSIAPVFAALLGQIWKLGAARCLRSSSQPLTPRHMLTHLFSHWVSPWRKIPQGKQNKTMNKTIHICWFISLSQCGWWQALLPPQKLGSEGFGWEWLVHRGRKTAPFKLSDQLHHIPESNHTKRTVKGGTQPSQGTGWCLHTSKQRALKAATFLPDTSKSACACCESPMCHAWGQPSME